MSGIELDEVETLADLADLAREATQDDETVLIYIEQEDTWFGVVRVDGEDDPRIFVSDGAAAARSSYGKVLTDELVEGVDEDEFDDLDDLVAELDADDDEVGGRPEEDEEEADEATAGHCDVPAGPIGDSELLVEFGLTGRDLRELATEGAEPDDVLSEIAEALGCGEVLEAVR